MAITANDVNLDKFLNNFTYTGDPNAGGKTQIALIDFLKIAAELKLCDNIERLRQSWH